MDLVAHLLCYSLEIKDKPREMILQYVYKEANES